MDSQVARVQPEGVLRKQSVPPLLPAYNKFMGGVDRTGHIRKTYGFDRKSKRFWLHLFQFFDYAIDIHMYSTSMTARGVKLGQRICLDFVLS